MKHSNTNWQPVPIGEMGSVITGKTPPKSDSQYWENGDLLFVSPKDLEFDSRTIKNSQNKVTQKAYKKFKNQVIPPNSIMFTSLSYGFGKIGIVEESALTNQQINTIALYDDFDRDFIYYLLRCNKKYLLSFNNGIDTPIVPKSVFEKIELPVPNLSTQKIIGNYLSKFDDLIVNNIQRIKILEEIAQRLYEEWFVNFKFPGHEKVKMADSELGEIPDGWKILPFPDLVKIQRGKSYGSIDLSDDEGLEFVNLKCIERNGGFRRDGLKKYTGDYKDGHVVHDGDIVMAVTDMTQARDLVGRVALIPKLRTEGVISMDLVKIIPKNIDSIYLYSYLRYSSIPHRLKNMANGANVLHLRPDKIESQSILLPPSEIIDKYSSIVSELIKLMNNLEEKNEILSQTRDLLLPRLISGDIEI